MNRDDLLEYVQVMDEDSGIRLYRSNNNDCDEKLYTIEELYAKSVTDEKYIRVTGYGSTSL